MLCVGVVDIRNRTLITILNLIKLKEDVRKRNLKTEEVALVLQGITLGLKNFSSQPIIDDEEFEDLHDDWSIISESEVANEYSDTGSTSYQTGSCLENIKNEESRVRETFDEENEIEMVKIEPTDYSKPNSEIEKDWSVSANHEAIPNHRLENEFDQDSSSALPISKSPDAPSVPPEGLPSPENQHNIYKSPFQKPKPKPIPILYKQKYAAIFVQKGRSKESKQEIEEMYKKDFPEIFPNTKYEKMSR